MCENSDDLSRKNWHSYTIPWKNWRRCWRYHFAPAISEREQKEKKDILKGLIIEERYILYNVKREREIVWRAWQWSRSPWLAWSGQEWRYQQGSFFSPLGTEPAEGPPLNAFPCVQKICTRDRLWSTSNSIKRLKCRLFSSFRLQSLFLWVNRLRPRRLGSKQQPFGTMSRSTKSTAKYTIYNGRMKRDQGMTPHCLRRY